VTVTGGGAEPALGYGAEILPGYRALAVVNRGREFEIYDAWSTARQSRCVVKVLRSGGAERDAWRSRLMLEGRLLSSLDHPHLVRGYEVYLKPRPAVVLETLGGSTVGHVVGRGTRLPVALVAHLGQQVASALHYLHGHGYLHLDVKPGNVIVDGGRARLIDLSLAQPPGPVAKGLGTRAYLSPEQGSGGVAAAAADVWGLGLLLHEAAAGVNPYRASRGTGSASGAGSCSTCGQAMSFRQVTERAPALRTLRPRLPRVLTGVVDAALELDAANRPTMAELRRAMVAVTGGDEPTW
jgi:eukaryotic-like serine/threonine-protein kinase